MDETKLYTIDEAHKYFAQSSNARVWTLLQQSKRSPEENEAMLRAAFASAYHWKFAGTVVHQQRGEWLICHVYAVLGHAREALRHAERCFELTQSYKEIMKDFDIAYAFEGLARSHAMMGDHHMAQEFFVLAQQAGQTIADEEDRSIFLSDFEQGPWSGLR